MRLNMNISVVDKILLNFNRTTGAVYLHTLDKTVFNRVSLLYIGLHLCEEINLNIRDLHIKKKGCRFVA